MTAAASEASAGVPAVVQAYIPETGEYLVAFPAMPEPEPGLEVEL